MDERRTDREEHQDNSRRGELAGDFPFENRGGGDGTHKERETKQKGSDSESRGSRVGAELLR